MSNQPVPEPKVAKKNLFRSIIGPLIAALVFTLAIWSLTHSLKGVNYGELFLHLEEISNRKLLFAALLTVLSFALLTGYDWLGLRYAGSELSYRKLAPISFSAFSVGLNAGFASFTGGAIRFRAYSEEGLSAVQVAIVITFISITFLLGASSVLGLALLTMTKEALAVFPINASYAVPFAFAFLLMPIGYLAWSVFARTEFKYRNWHFKSPSASIASMQIAIAIADLILVASILFQFLPDSLEISYSAFLTAFILATAAGVLSNLPGGIGAFESVLLLMLPAVPPTVLLGSILAYRAFYFFAPLGLAFVLIIWRELSEKHKAKLHVTARASVQWASKISPQAFSFAAFIAGTAMLFGGALPIDKPNLSAIANNFSLPILEASHLLSSAMGVALLVLARGLYQRLKGACSATLILLMVGILTSYVHSGSSFYILILATIWLMVWLSRKEFYRGGLLIDQHFSPAWIASIAFVLVTSGALGLFAYQHVEYADELWWKFALDANVSRMLRAELLALLLITIFMFARLLRGRTHQCHVPNLAEKATIKNIVAKSVLAEANVALLGDKRFLVHPSGEAFIMYQISGSSWIALGDPVGNSQFFEELCWDFRELCDQYNARCVFYRVTKMQLPLYIKLGIGFVKLGNEAKVDLTSFALEGSRRADLRQAMSRGKRDGGVFSVVPANEVPLIMDQLKVISDSWLAEKSVAEKGFSLGIFDPEYLANFDIAVIKVGDEIVAFANLWPTTGKQELSVDLMRFNKNAPKGVMDYLFVNLMLWGKEQSFQSFSLGMAPLSGIENHDLAPLWNKFGHAIFHFGGNFYNFEGLHAYKEKFDPTWEPRFIACKHGFEFPRILLDIAVLISGGIKGLFFK